VQPNPEERQEGKSSMNPEANSKLEIRSSKQMRMTERGKFETIKREAPPVRLAGAGFRTLLSSSFEFVSDFGIRDSNLNRDFGIRISNFTSGGA
jgi:hypothetical protein